MFRVKSKDTRATLLTPLSMALTFNHPTIKVSQKRFINTFLQPVQRKTCVRSLFFIFSTKWKSPLISWKMMFISSKKLFSLSRYSIFLFPSSLFFFAVSHWLRGWSKINLKVYDAINCLTKNLTHFVWYLEKEKRYDIETLSIDRVWNEEQFSWKIMQKMCTNS